MLLVRGTNVYPRAIESIVRSYPEIDEFRVVVSTVDPVTGDRVKSAVVGLHVEAGRAAACCAVMAAVFAAGRTAEYGHKTCSPFRLKSLMPLIESSFFIPVIHISHNLSLTNDLPAYKLGTQCIKLIKRFLV